MQHAWSAGVLLARDARLPRPPSRSRRACPRGCGWHSPDRTRRSPPSWATPCPAGAMSSGSSEPSPSGATPPSGRRVRHFAPPKGGFRGCGQRLNPASAGLSRDWTESMSARPPIRGARPCQWVLSSGWRETGRGRQRLRINRRRSSEDGFRPASFPSVFGPAPRLPPTVGLPRM